MARITARFVRPTALLLGTMFMAMSSIAGAQVPEEQVAPEIVVTAPRAVPVPAERTPYAGEPVLIATVKIPVRLGDLDLKDPASGDRLFTRIKRVAQDACGQLDRPYPLNPDPNCIDRAIAAVRPAAEALLKATRG